MLPFAVLWGLIALWLGRAYRHRDAVAAEGEKQ
jgi:hypothetical protein